MSLTLSNTNLIQVRHATKKSGGSTSNTRTSNPKYLGFKRFHGSKVIPGNIILRQRGTRWHPCNGVGIGRDHTIFALVEGRVVVHYDLATQRRYISVNDGTLETFPSKVEMKRRLTDTIDISHYMTLTNKERYDYVMQMIQTLTETDQIKRKAETDQRLTETGRRKFILHDLTLI
ncbi:ribosomal L27 protein [Batrachochytrium dendrobatidis JEL423]|uniref:Large ribosomal subunit protein bL27m n=2 Tax=Batrachochytrium dendrobatidis TaxID=109871 RepID=A0A177WBE4_BATDL|nr:ribosomal L27 protein [Batrachochytrium dendrobatidis JEL423]